MSTACAGTRSTAPPEGPPPPDPSVVPGSGPGAPRPEGALHHGVLSHGEALLFYTDGVTDVQAAAVDLHFEVVKFTIPIIACGIEAQRVRDTGIVDRGTNGLIEVVGVVKRAAAGPITRWTAGMLAPGVRRTASCSDAAGSAFSRVGAGTYATRPS